MVMVRDREKQKMKLQMKLLQIRFEKKEIDEMLDNKLLELRTDNSRVFSPSTKTMMSFKTERGQTLKPVRPFCNPHSSSGKGFSVQRRNIVTQPSNSYPIFTVSNGTHQITVNNDLSFRIIPLPVPQINFIDVNSQYVFCNGVQELGIYGNGRIVYLPMFYSYPAFITPVYVPKYVITGFFNGTHRVTVYNDGQVYATPMVYFYPQPVFYDANLVRTDLNNGTHDIKVFNSGRLLIKRLPIFG